MMNNLIQLFVLKMVDTIINSGKTIFLIRGQKFLSALSQAISNIFYVITLRCVNYKLFLIFML